MQRIPSPRSVATMFLSIGGEATTMLKSSTGAKAIDPKSELLLTHKREISANI